MTVTALFGELEELVEKVKSTVIMLSLRQNNLILISLSEDRSFGSLVRWIYTSKSPGSISETCSF